MQLTLIGSFPERVSGAMFEGTVTLVNDGDERLKGLAASAPDVYVMQGGEIVAAAMPKDDVGVVVELLPGASREFPAKGSLRALPPGRYEVLAVLRIDGNTAVGGPWPLQVA